MCTCVLVNMFLHKENCQPMCTMGNMIQNLIYKSFTCWLIIHCKFTVMNCNRKIYADVFESGVLVSIWEKKNLNLTMLDKINYFVTEISKKKSTLHLYWYSLKYFVHSLHGGYRLLYKMLWKYGNSSMCWKNKYHNLMNRPRPIPDNLEIFSDLIKFILIQIGLIGAMVRLSSDINIHNQVNCLLYWLVIVLDKVIWNENSWSEFTLNGLPIKYNWMWIQCGTIQWMQEQEVKVLYNTILTKLFTARCWTVQSIHQEHECHHDTILTNLFATTGWTVEGIQQWDKCHHDTTPTKMQKFGLCIGISIDLVA